MPKLVTVDQVIKIEKEANALGISYDQMMRNAGNSLAKIVTERYKNLFHGGICGLIGGGNNGGDTLVALSHIASQGWRVSAYLVRSRQVDDPLVKGILDQKASIYTLENDPGFIELRYILASHAIILDGILGTGFQLPLKPELAEVLSEVKATLQTLSDPPVVVAVDCPSGVDCDNGEAADGVIPASLTVTMAAVKTGLLELPAFKLAGELVVADIGLPDQGRNMSSWQDVKTFIPDRFWVRDRIPDRPFNAHKGTFGALLIIAGSTNYSGAAWLAGQAAYRVGTGLVTLAVPETIQPVLASSFAEATWLPLPEQDGFIDQDADRVILDQLDKFSAILLGPGFGQATQTGRFIENFLKLRSQKSMGFIDNQSAVVHQSIKRLPPMIVDADGLKLLKQIPRWYELLPPESILTPHPGEMSILTEIPKEAIQADRIGTAIKFSREWEHIVVLKGAFTVIASPDQQAAVIPIASPALARAGTGDVLAGIISGLSAQGMSQFEAAAAGAWIHGRAGLLAAKTIGNDASVLAGDLIRSIAQVYSEELK